jgi:hypothetical protein
MILIPKLLLFSGSSVITGYFSLTEGLFNGIDKFGDECQK